MFRMLANFFSLSRFHIVLIAAGGSLVFGWLLTGSFWPSLALVAALDWFLVNIVNRVVDAPEDTENRIRAAEFALGRKRAIYLLAVVLYAASFTIHFFWRPELVWPRLAYHLLGLLYNFRLIPLKGRLVRLKELYFFKNSASCAGFLLTLFAYPLVTLTVRPEIDVLYLFLLVAFFAPLELSFEVIYDLRDVKGDRLANIASYPLARGEEFSNRLIVILNVVSIYAILAGAAFGIFGLKETILIFAPIIQIVLFWRGVRRGFSPRDCVNITWTFAAMNYVYCLWVLAGLPVACPFSVTLPMIIEAGLVVIGLVSWPWYGKLYGSGRYASAFGILIAGSWLAEQTAVSFYGFYRYSPSWDIFIGGVPAAIILIWPMIILSTHHLMRRFGLAGWKAVAGGTLTVIFEAALIEVVCANAGLWTWKGQGIFGVPVIGIIGWGCFALGALFSVEFLVGRRIFWLPVIGFATTHGFLQILWRLFFKRVSYAPISPAVLLDVMALLCIGLTFLAARKRKQIEISMTEIVPRVLAAQLMYYILFASKPQLAPAAFCCLFIPPYLVMPVYDWVMPGERGPKILAPRTASGLSCQDVPLGVLSAMSSKD